MFGGSGQFQGYISMSLNYEQRNSTLKDPKPLIRLSLYLMMCLMCPSHNQWLRTVALGTPSTYCTLRGASTSSSNERVAVDLCYCITKNGSEGRRKDRFEFSARMGVRFDVLLELGPRGCNRKHTGQGKFD